jgi:hypothetical protein
MFVCLISYRWVRGICEAIRPLETLDVEGLVRLWAHEALRLFQDRLGRTHLRYAADNWSLCSTALTNFRWCGVSGFFCLQLTVYRIAIPI